MRTHNRVRTIMRNLLLAVFAFAIALGAVELVLRTTHLFNARVSWTEPDPWIGWRFTPGREYWFFQENDHAIEGRINAMGWRDRERERAKHTNTRIAVIGDSYVEAFQVELDSTFVAIAEGITRTRGTQEMRTYEFMNFGRSGMGQSEENIVLRRDVLPCAPDVVVLLFTPSNDIAGANPATAETLLRPFCSFDAQDSLRIDYSFRDAPAYKFRKRLNPFKQHSALVSLVAERYNASRLMRAKNAAPKEVSLTREQTLMTDHPDATYLANYVLAKRIVIEMARTFESRGYAMILMSVPLVYEDTEIATLRELDPSFDPGYFDRDLSAMADTSGIAFVPLTEAFRARRRETGEPLHWAHWNYHGHRLVGELLAEAVAQVGAAPVLRN